MDVHVVLVVLLLQDDVEGIVVHAVPGFQLVAHVAGAVRAQDHVPFRHNDPPVSALPGRMVVDFFPLSSYNKGRKRACRYHGQPSNTVIENDRIPWLGRSFSFVPVGPQGPQEPGEAKEHEHHLAKVSERHVHGKSPLSRGETFFAKVSKRISYPAGDKTPLLFTEG